MRQARRLVVVAMLRLVQLYTAACSLGMSFPVVYSSTLLDMKANGIVFMLKISYFLVFSDIVNEQLQLYNSASLLAYDWNRPHRHRPGDLRIRLCMLYRLSAWSGV